MPLTLRIRRVVEEAPDIRSFELVPGEGRRLPPVSAGAHVAVFLGNGLVRHYSIASDPADRSRYLIAVLREAAGRGGSAWIFENWREGTWVEIAEPSNHFPLAAEAERHLLVAGGIGITPLLAMAYSLERQAADYRLYYCTRTAERTAFRALLSRPPFAGRVVLVHDEGDPAKGFDLQALLRQRQPGTHTYCCGPEGLIKAFRAAAAHWPQEAVHVEYFAADPEASLYQGAERPFAVELASSGRVFEIPADRSILSVLAEAGIAVPKLCEEGLCGSCMTGVRDGIPDHRDRVQTDAEKAENDYMTLCCSRSKSPRLVLDL